MNEQLDQAMDAQGPEGVLERLLSDPAIVEAMRLSDLFDAVKPQEYVLPLDAMAGFPMAAQAG